MEISSRHFEDVYKVSSPLPLRQPSAKNYRQYMVQRRRRAGGPDNRPKIDRNHTYLLGSGAKHDHDTPLRFSMGKTLDSYYCQTMLMTHTTLAEHEISLFATLRPRQTRVEADEIYSTEHPSQDETQTDSGSLETSNISFDENFPRYNTEHLKSSKEDDERYSTTPETFEEFLDGLFPNAYSDGWQEIVCEEQSTATVVQRLRHNFCLDK